MIDANIEQMRGILAMQTDVINKLRAELNEIRAPKPVAWMHVWDGGHSVHASEQDARDEIAKSFREVGLPPGHVAEPSYLCAVVGVARQVSTVVWSDEL